MYIIILRTTTKITIQIVIVKPKDKLKSISKKYSNNPKESRKWKTEETNVK